MRYGLHTGHVIVDNRASHHGLFEDDVVGCVHCQKTMNLSDWRKKGGWCTCCDAHLCLQCAKKTKKDGCLPWRKLVDDHLENQYRLGQNAKILGLNLD